MCSETEASASALKAEAWRTPSSMATNSVGEDGSLGVQSRSKRAVSMVQTRLEAPAGESRFGDDLHCGFVARLELFPPGFEEAVPIFRVFRFKGRTFCSEVSPCLSALFEECSRASADFMACFFTGAAWGRSLTGRRAGICRVWL